MEKKNGRKKGDNSPGVVGKIGIGVEPKSKNKKSKLTFNKVNF